MRRAAALLAFALAWPAAVQDAGAQGADTLADIRQQLAMLDVELSALTRDLSTTGAPGVALPGASAGLIERIDAIEAELRRLTAAAEAAQFRVEQVARDGANRLDDLRFRLCELTPDCDVAALPAPAPLGETPTAPAPTPAAPADVAAATQPPAAGARPVRRPEGGAAQPLDAPAAVAPVAPAQPAPAPSFDTAVGEQAEFDAARATLDAGQDAAAAEAFGRFVAVYPTGPLATEAHFLRGQALARSGQTEAAARSYLEAFSGAPEGGRAADALLGLGRSLGALGQTDEACLTLQEVEARFPGVPAVPEARAALASLGCG